MFNKNIEITENNLCLLTIFFLFYRIQSANKKSQSKLSRKGFQEKEIEFYDYL